MLVINIDSEGHLHCLYSEKLNFEEFGDEISINRASNVEPMPNESGRWYVEILSTGKIFTKDTRTGKEFLKRSEALDFEVWYLQEKM
jgi:hypothetical protein